MFHLNKYSEFQHFFFQVFPRCQVGEYKTNCTDVPFFISQTARQSVQRPLVSCVTDSNI